MKVEEKIAPVNTVLDDFEVSFEEKKSKKNRKNKREPNSKQDVEEQMGDQLRTKARDENSTFASDAGTSRADAAVGQQVIMDANTDAVSLSQLQSGNLAGNNEGRRSSNENADAADGDMKSLATATTLPFSDKDFSSSNSHDNTEQSSILSLGNTEHNEPREELSCETRKHILPLTPSKEPTTEKIDESIKKNELRSLPCSENYDMTDVTYAPLQSKGSSRQKVSDLDKTIRAEAYSGDLQYASRSSFPDVNQKIRSDAAAESYEADSFGRIPQRRSVSKKDINKSSTGLLLESAAENYDIAKKLQPTPYLESAAEDYEIAKKSQPSPYLESAAENYEIANQLEEGLASIGHPSTVERRKSTTNMGYAIKRESIGSQVEGQLGAFSISRRSSAEATPPDFGRETEDALEVSMVSSSLSRTGHSDIDGSKEFLVQAERVDEPAKVYATARADPWWRRNQAWLAATVVLIIIGSVLTAVLSSIDLNGPEAPSTAPTSVAQGIQTKIQELILSEYPLTDFTEPTSVQSKTVEWLSDMKQENLDWYTDERVLIQYTLVKFFLSTSNGGKEGSSWLEDNGWMESRNQCEWYGITCDESGTIVNLMLSNNNLMGELHSELPLISKKLTSLDLSNNSIGGGIPEEIGKLSELKYLDLSNNALTGSISSSIGESTMLITLNLSNNQLKSIIPPEIGRLSMLTSVNLGDNQLIGSIPSDIGMLTRIGEINCQNNRLTYELPSEIGNLNSLGKLNLQNNDLLGPLPSEMGLLTTLRDLDLSDNHIFYQIPVQLYRSGGLAALESLDLSNNLLSGMLYEETGGSPVYDFGASWQKLKTLRLSGNYFEKSLPQANGALYSLPLLEVLDLSSNYLTGTLPIGISQLTTVKSLDLSNNQLEGLLPDFLMDLEGLNMLNLSRNKFEGTLTSTIGKLSGLTNLDLSNNALAGELPTNLGSLSLLTTLHIADNKRIKGNIPTDIGRLIGLKSLDLSSNVGIVGIIPTEIGELSTLEFLDLSRNRISGSIPNEFQALTSLTTLRMGTNLLNSTLPELLSNFTRLEDLSLPENRLSGFFPSYIGNLSMLRHLDFGANKLQGTIPSEIGKHIILSTLLIKLSLTSLISFEGLLGELATLRIYTNSLSGSIPSEIGNLQRLKFLSLTTNFKLEGSVPTELANLVSLTTLSIASTNLSGSIPSSLCANFATANIRVDCSKVSCSCPLCGCSQVENSPSFEPTAWQVDNEDAQELAPSIAPTDLPQSSACSLFESISSDGLALDTTNDAHIELQFNFTWGGSMNFDHVDIDKFNSINFGRSDEKGACYQALAPSMFLINFGLPQAFKGPVYFLSSEASAIFSWENVQADDGSNDPYFLNFQTEIYADGSFEFRWGEGAYANQYQVLSGFTDTCNNYRSGVTGYPFEFGIIATGVWPTNQCRLVLPDGDGFYVENI